MTEREWSDLRARVQSAVDHGKARKALAVAIDVPDVEALLALASTQVAWFTPAEPQGSAPQ